MTQAQSLGLDKSDWDLCARAFRKESMLMRIRTYLIPAAATAASIAVVTSAIRASAGYPYSDVWQPPPPTDEQVLVPGPLGLFAGAVSYVVSAVITYFMVEYFGLVTYYSAYRK